MLKKICLLAFLPAFIGFSLQAQDVSVSLSLPDQAIAGEKIPVKVVINKGSHSDFARFKQKIPAGFKVEPVQTANSDFTYKEGEVNFIWLKLPPENKITLVYSLIPDIRLQGIFHFSGWFSYIKDSEREEVIFPKKTIKILPSATAATSPASGMNKNTGAATSGMAGGKASVFPLAIYRQTPVRAPDGRGWIVHILLSRGNIDKLGRIEEKVPAGYRAENIEDKGAIFSFRGGVVKYIWMIFPPESLIVVSYRLVPGNNAPKGVPKVTGTFSYMLNDNPASMPITPVQQTIPSHPSVKERRLLMAELEKTGSEGASIGTTASQVSPAESATENKTSLAKAKSGHVTFPAIPSENKPGQPTKIIQHTASDGRGIYFRVQIMATEHPIKIEQYLVVHHIPGKIYRETNQGLYKYTTGSFTLYKDARAFINHLVTTTDIQGAFVIAYDNGKRIPVSVALNRTGQAWFK